MKHPHVRCVRTMILTVLRSHDTITRLVMPCVRYANTSRESQADLSINAPYPSLINWFVIYRRLKVKRDEPTADQTVIPSFNIGEDIIPDIGPDLTNQKALVLSVIMASRTHL
ncbi:5974_t:CDS:2 [Paraglomus occultum]|uniref:5974_t:CDS:1 n=1 Tax=Paraglomus occultum TaxID=144539 RepID=A0A9N9AD63_9GLOM|nr:5974_t:CDS:2 [Paraglomus occultum]